MRSEMRWRLCWESELELADHIELSEFFRKAYGANGEFNAKPFEGGRSWAGARPELRVIAYDSQGIAGHAGVLRRFIKVGTVDVLVAEIGLYAVRRDLEGRGVTYHGAIHFMYPTLQELGVPFGFGGVRPAMQKHVERIGRHGFATVFTGMRVRSTQPDIYLNVPATRDEDVLVVVLPIAQSMGDWPAGTTIARNGPEL
ncbi:acyltransferase [Bradyrhizobium centrolobii]|uniref:Nodulation protein A n=2 Tax=Bradyrhizobium TaxID=374 RepID=A0A176YZA4_9BRAD|nr:MULTISPECIES: NodA family N-acyltransferase [Bradyrhizobium]OAF09202.1 acyltransferase [Bradyrhizobium centrolobii]OAF13126.1 acyltransferase [Bradyrhizobium neotropicale]